VLVTAVDRRVRARMDMRWRLEPRPRKSLAPCSAQAADAATLWADFAERSAWRSEDSDQDEEVLCRSNKEGKNVSRKGARSHLTATILM
jgi:hypothetical protein